MRFHLVALPHTQVSQSFSACAFTEKVRKFAVMMKARGHTVFLYAGEVREAPSDEHIVCFSEAERQAAVGDKHYTDANWDPAAPHWQAFNGNVIRELARRAEPQDFICLIGGRSQAAIAEAFPDMLSVEYGVGYSATFAKYRVFESYAWMHTIYGAETKGNASAADGRWFDDVIPGYLDMDQFPVHARNPKEDYYLYIGRLIDRKGYQIAVDVCQALGKQLIVAGPGTPPGYGGYVGVVGPKVRARLMAGAHAVFAPTIYVEPFGNVAIEAMACGTPAITTDWGAFTETVVEGVTGFRCRTFGQFLRAAEQAKSLDREAIRAHAIAIYSLDVIGKKYETYFERLSLLWGDGWATRTA